jgi:hypothetical protein
MTNESVDTIKVLEPHVLASGHGEPMTGDGIKRELYAFADQFSGLAAAKQ